VSKSTHIKSAIYVRFSAIPDTKACIALKFPYNNFNVAYKADRIMLKSSLWFTRKLLFLAPLGERKLEKHG
jgi:hypothetical protein